MPGARHAPRSGRCRRTCRRSADDRPRPGPVLHRRQSEGRGRGPGRGGRRACSSSASRTGDDLFARRSGRDHRVKYPITLALGISEAGHAACRGLQGPERGWHRGRRPRPRGQRAAVPDGPPHRDPVAARVPDGARPGPGPDTRAPRRLRRLAGARHHSSPRRRSRTTAARSSGPGRCTSPSPAPTPPSFVVYFSVRAHLGAHHHRHRHDRLGGHGPARCPGRHARLLRHAAVRLDRVPQRLARRPAGRHVQRLPRLLLGLRRRDRGGRRHRRALAVPALGEARVASGATEEDSALLDPADFT